MTTYDLTIKIKIVLMKCHLFNSFDMSDSEVLINFMIFTLNYNLEPRTYDQIKIFWRDGLCLHLQLLFLSIQQRFGRSFMFVLFSADLTVLRQVVVVLSFVLASFAETDV